MLEKHRNSSWCPEKVRSSSRREWSEDGVAQSREGAGGETVLTFGTHLVLIIAYAEREL